METPHSFTPYPPTNGNLSPPGPFSTPHRDVSVPPSTPLSTLHQFDSPDLMTSLRYSTNNSHPALPVHQSADFRVSASHGQVDGPHGSCIMQASEDHLTRYQNAPFLLLKQQVDTLQRRLFELETENRVYKQNYDDIISKLPQLLGMDPNESIKAQPAHTFLQGRIVLGLGWDFLKPITPHGVQLMWWDSSRSKEMRTMNSGGKPGQHSEEVNVGQQYLEDENGMVISGRVAKDVRNRMRACIHSLIWSGQATPTETHLGHEARMYTSVFKSSSTEGAAPKKRKQTQVTDTVNKRAKLDETASPVYSSTSMPDSRATSTTPAPSLPQTLLTLLPPLSPPPLFGLDSSLSSGMLTLSPSFLSAPSLPPLPAISAVPAGPPAISTSITISAAPAPAHTASAALALSAVLDAAPAISAALARAAAQAVGAAPAAARTAGAMHTVSTAPAVSTAPTNFTAPASAPAISTALTVSAEGVVGATPAATHTAGAACTVSAAPVASAAPIASTVRVASTVHVASTIPAVSAAPTNFTAPASTPAISTALTISAAPGIGAAPTATHTAGAACTVSAAPVASTARTDSIASAAAPAIATAITVSAAPAGAAVPTAVCTSIPEQPSGGPPKPRTIVPVRTPFSTLRRRSTRNGAATEVQDGVGQFDSELAASMTTSPDGSPSLPPDAQASGGDPEPTPKASGGQTARRRIPKEYELARLAYQEGIASEKNLYLKRLLDEDPDLSMTYGEFQEAFKNISDDLRKELNDAKCEALRAKRAKPVIP
ncbi:hypothetical protein V8D89_000268 [Ganoderma adspersum]